MLLTVNMFAMLLVELAICTFTIGIVYLIVTKDEWKLLQQHPILYRMYEFRDMQSMIDSQNRIIKFYLFRYMIPIFVVLNVVYIIGVNVYGRTS